MTQLAVQVGAHTSTISAMVFGSRETKPDIVEAVADALRVDRVTVFEWVGRARAQEKPFQPHPDADLLTAEEQDVVNHLIRLLAKGRAAHVWQGTGSGKAATMVAHQLAHAARPGQPADVWRDAAHDEELHGSQETGADDPA